jgi:hypothetical protein
LPPSEPVPGPPAEAPPAHPLEEPQRLSRSLIWPLQRAFYARQGRDAWKPGVVPFYTTSNPFFVRAYARMVVAFLRDLAAGGALDRGQPVYLVELAAGSGQFAFLFLRRFEQLRRLVPALEGLQVVYVMTDFAESNLASWAAADRPQASFSHGRLDFARFDIERDTSLELIRSGVILAPGTVRNPILAIANYAFDTTLQDAFWVRDKKLWEARVTPVSSQAEPDPAAADLLSRVHLRWEKAPAAVPYYGDAVLDGILDGYRERLGDTFFLFPVGAFHALRALSDLADGRLFLLCGDKAFTHERELRARPEPAFTLHASSFSMTVNLHAMGLWFEQAGGCALHAKARDATLRVSALLRGLPGVEIPETRSAFSEAFDGFAPSDYHALVRGLAEEHRKPALPVLLALLRLGDWDHQIIFTYAEHLVELAKSATPSQAAEILLALRKVWEGFYPMTRDLPYELGRIALPMRPAEAVLYLAESVRLFGPRAMNLMALGYACTLLGRHAEAKKLLDQSLALQPDNVAARALRDQLIARLPPGPS